MEETMKIYYFLTVGAVITIDVKFFISQVKLRYEGRLETI